MCVCIYVYISIYSYICIYMYLYVYILFDGFSKTLKKVEGPLPLQVHIEVFSDSCIREEPCLMYRSVGGGFKCRGHVMMHSDAWCI